jgi:hypothetical protein
MTQTFEIYLDDLNEEARKRFLKFHDVESGEELNAEFIPIAILEYQEDGDSQ